MKEIMIYDKMELSAIQLILLFDEFLVHVLEVASQNDGKIDSTVVSRDFAVKKFREKMEKQDSSSDKIGGVA